MNIQNHINLTKTFHTEMSLLLSYKCMFSSIVEALMNELSYFHDSDLSPIFSKSTLDKHRLFIDKLNTYLESKNYTEDQIFVYIDSEWYDLIDEYLIPLLKTIEFEMDSKEINYYSRIKDYDREFKPSYSEILSRVQILYESKFDS